MTISHRAGFVTIIGRPNAGKSTLLNAFLGQKIAIVTPKPQTTRDRIVGICQRPNGQIVFLDTPGVHRGKRALNKHLTDVALSSIEDVDAVLFVLDVLRCGEGIGKADNAIIKKLVASKKPVLCCLNKIDQVRKDSLLPLISELSSRELFAAVIPVSATRADGLESVLDGLLELLPEGPALYDDDALTDKPVRFLCSELLREQLMIALGQELPYSIAVEITSFKERSDRPLVDIDATIHVERSSQKGIVLGKGGVQIKAISTAARAQMEDLLQCQVFLRAHVRVEPNWTSSPKGMRKLGYDKK